MKDSKGYEPSDYITSVSNTLNGLEALKNLYLKTSDYTHIICVKDYEIIKKELVALEIIKKKGILVNGLIKSVDIGEYNTLCNYYQMSDLLTQEEYELLKEIL